MAENFLKWLEESFEKPPLSNDDLLHATLPLIEQIIDCHEQNLVAPFDQISSFEVEENTIFFKADFARKPAFNKGAINRINSNIKNDLAILVKDEFNDDTIDQKNSGFSVVGKPGSEIKSPVYLPGWVSWELELGHHDPLSDVFSCGMLLATLATGLDLGHEDGLNEFIAGRSNLFKFNSKLHPVVAKIILDLTQVDRHKRIQDLPSALDALKNYRSQRISEKKDELIEDSTASAQSGRKRILNKLRDRLFDLTKRNRLLYYKQSLGVINLSEVSIPVMLSVSNIKPDQLCTWQGKVKEALSNGKTLKLGEHLRFEDAPYLSGLLERLRAEDKRNRNEYGFSMLRLSICFLRWHNLKEEKDERIHTPLLLLPVHLEKKKGVRDAWLLEPLSNIAQVNPVLRYQLDQLYDLKLPAEINLAETDLKELHDHLNKQIQASEPGVTLNFLDKPQVDLIHKKARKRLEVYNRRGRMTGKGIRRHEDIDYSYSQQNFKPLGMQMFLNYVQDRDWPLSDFLGVKPKPRMPNVAESQDIKDSKETKDVEEKDIIKSSTYQLKQGSENNPYNWDFDLCNMTVGNFNYRKMTLVRDYNQLIEDESIQTPSFEELFTAQPQSGKKNQPQPLPYEDRYDIIACDPTQAGAITQAQDQFSFIIQGPPGTGKSQTITNLIADFTARGKRVLFVCEKRAALDVVFHRLKQNGLDKLCCIIHDSHDDKKSFIQELRQTYDAYLGQSDEYQEKKKNRENIVKSLVRHCDQLRNIGTMLNQKAENQSLSPIENIRKLIKLKEFIPEFTEQDSEKFPSFANWQKVIDLVLEIEEAVRDISDASCFGAHPLSTLDEKCLQQDRVASTLGKWIETALEEQQQLLKGLKDIDLNLIQSLTIVATEGLIDYIEQIADFSEKQIGGLLDPQSSEMKILKEQLQQRNKLEHELSKEEKLIKNWREPIGEHEIDSVLDVTLKCEQTWFRFLRPTYWSIRKTMLNKYDFNAHSLPPKWSDLLKQLKGYYKTKESISDLDYQFGVDYLPGNASQLLDRVKALHQNEDQLSEAQKMVRNKVIQNQDSFKMVQKIISLRKNVSALKNQLDQIFRVPEDYPLLEIENKLLHLDQSIEALPAIAAPLHSLVKADSDIYQFLCTNQWSNKHCEAALLKSELESIYRQNREIRDLDGLKIESICEKASKQLKEFTSQNAGVIVSSVHHKLREQVARAGLPNAQLNSEEKEWKKFYTVGRKELEHEFGKVMRYKSIRDLAANETGLVLSDLKPVWLMSPLSVSDTLPMDSTLFDVVIFDEASQIPLEEAAPALFRARKCIVVGDEQQLPPTNFFGNRQLQDEDDEELDENDSYLELDADSFLSHSSLTLPSTMLGWHYRSRSELLINFSNASFYQRSLLTIPDQNRLEKEPNIAIKDPQEGLNNGNLVLNRPISYHRLENGLYLNRRNKPEADYIAFLVDSLLQQNNKLSIGIVAFSEAQQDEIEKSIQQKMSESQEVQERFEEAFEREEDDQFVGLFIKNLENVQGDERDIIILSICYGYDKSHKMRMNFGPINKSGGEKRLNVVFSRAKLHMVVVTSIGHEDITNEYNDGANCLKRYLKYASACSRGELTELERVLEECYPDEAKIMVQNTSDDILLQDIKSYIKEIGYEADENIGSSRFRCHLAVRAKDQSNYCLGILIDDDAHYKNDNVVEQYIQRPKVLSAFKWKTTRIFSRDWLEDQERVKREIKSLLS